MIKLYNSDCLEAMKSIPDSSIDMILCDPPYQETHNSWDKAIPFKPLWEQYERIIKNNGAIVLFGSEPFASSLRLSNPKFYRYDWIWEKTKAGGFLNANRMPLQAHEYICVFYKKLPCYNPQMQVGKPYVKKAVTNGDGNNYGKFERVGQVNVNSGTRYPRSVIRFANDNHNSLHPTQKPVELLEYLIRTYTNAGDIVLDNCMGSGSTGIACINTERDFIGIEMDEHFYQVAKSRIESTRKELL